MSSLIVKSKPKNSIHYSTEFIDLLLSKVDMMDVMKKYGIEVRPGSGKSNFYKASFCCNKTDFDNGRIKKDTQTYRCLSCHTGGNALHFLQQVAELSFRESVIELAHMFDVELPVIDPDELKKIERKEKALKLAIEFYQSQNNTDYMISRGLSEEVIQKHKIGYAPGGRALRSYLEQQGYTKAELLEYRLLNAKGLDSFFYRAIIPVIMNGKVTDIYGRAVNDAKAGIKHFYLKGDNILGGIDYIDPKKTVYLFEAAIDRLVAESHGIDNGIDTGGAGKFSSYHAKRLKKMNIEKIMIIYDGDAAGIKGALHAGQLLIEQGIKVWIGELPNQMDPAKMLLEKGKQAFIDALYNPKTFTKFKMYQELRKYKLEDILEYVSDTSKESELN